MKRAAGERGMTGKLRVVVRVYCVITLLVTLRAYAEQRFALVIGNADYTRLSHNAQLKNAAKDAQDMAAALKGLGFTVNLLIDADAPEMDDAVVNFGNQLSLSPEAVGFFYYAGHGVQSSGVNYLIPTDAQIPSEAFLGTRALAVQTVLSTMRSSGNKLNIVVLDACRDNPFAWSRSAARGLTVVGVQPPGSIVAYAAGAGEVAQDGTGANGKFTGELLKHLSEPGVTIYEVFRQTAAAVIADTNGSQNPALSIQFYENFYLAGSPHIAPQEPVVGGPSAFEKGEVLFVQEKLQDARPLLEIALNEDPSNEKIYLYLGIIYQQLGYPQKAIDILKRGLKAATSYKDLFYYNMGNDFFSRKEYALAEEMYNDALSANKNLGQGYLNRANARLQLQNFNGAAADYVVFLQLFPQDPQRPDIEKMIALLRRAQHGQEKASLAALAKQLAQQPTPPPPENSDDLAFAGLSWWRENPTDSASVQKAVDLSKKAIDKNPDNWLPHKTLGEIYDSRKLSDDAMREYKTAARLNPEDADTLYALGKLQYRAKLFSDAQKSFEGCVALRPDFTRAHFNRGMSLVQLGDKTHAIDAFKSAIATKKDDADSYYMVGYLLRDKGDLAGALDSFKLAAQYAPDNTGYMRELGAMYMVRGDFAGAESTFNRALAQDPRSTVANYNMASVKIKLGKPREALPFAQKAVDQDANSATANYILGLANEKLGNTDDALKYYGAALDKDPKFAPALINLGGMYDSRGMPDKALPLLLTAQDVQPDSYEVQNNLGNVYLHQQQYQDSITHLSKALSIQPDSKVTEYNLAIAYAETGQIPEAKKGFMNVLAKDPSNLDVYIKLARIFIKEGDSKDAKDLLTGLLAKNPRADYRDEAQLLLGQMK